MIPELAYHAHLLRPFQTIRVPCPKCDRGASDRAFALTRDAIGLVWKCHRCGWSGADNHEARTSNISPKKVQQASPNMARSFYEGSKRITDTDVAGQYLLARGCVLPPSGTHLRWHPSVRHPSGHVGPALVAAVTNIETREFMSVHRTWLDPVRPGKKADVQPPRCFWRGLQVRGGVVRLWPDELVHGGLGIGEGIETCLALAHAYTPVWSCLDAGHLSAFPVLNGIESLVIAMDNDPAGAKATKACSERWTEAGAEVLIVASEHDGHDVADEAVA